MTASASGNRYIDLAISVQVADVERNAAGRPRWKAGSHVQLLRIGGCYDRRKRKWKCGATAKTLPIIFHRGQERAARWFCEWLTRFVRGDWANYKRAWSVLLIGGRRSGKTHLACAALVLFAVLNPRALLWAISPTLETGDELDETLRSLLPRRWYVRKQAKTGRSTTFRLVNGSRILLKSAVKPERLKAGRVDLALLNECQELSQRAYVKLRGAIVDRGGLVVMTANPPETPMGRWVEDYYNRARAGSIKGEVFELDPEANPWIEHEGLLEMANEVDDATYQRDVLGLFPPIGDVVFEQWSDRESVRTTDGLVDITAELTKKILGRPFKYVIGIDLQQQPHMAASVRKYFELPEDPGEIYTGLVGEVVVEEADEDELIDAMEESGLEAEECAVVMDASAWWQDGAHHKGKTSDRKFKARGWVWLYKPQKDSDRNPDIMVRINCTRARLKSAKVEGGPPPKRRLFSVPTNERTNRGLRDWENKNGFPNRRSVHAHVCDAVSYPEYRFFGRPKPKKKRGEYRGVNSFERADLF